MIGYWFWTKRALVKHVEEQQRRLREQAAELESLRRFRKGQA